MRPRLSVLVTREEIRPERLPGTTTVVVDVFMATTTLLTILENGARRVFPAGSLDEAERLCAMLDRATLLRGGEQNARPVEGFDCGPFPDEYPPERVSGHDVVYVSTNGTAAIARAAPASRLLVASLRNAPAVAGHLAEVAPDHLYIVCAGSGGRLSLDDLAGAAAIVSRLDVGGWSLNDAAWLARDLGRRYEGRIQALLRRGRAGRWFVEHDRLDALEFVSDVGASDLVAEVRSGEMVAVETCMA